MTTPFIPLRKVDAGKRRVYAEIDETPDRVGDIFDYATSKPNFVTWSEEMRTASGGKSLGNVRAMHQLIAAGKVDEIVYDDAARRLGFWMEIVDAEEWRKCEEGVYSGISPGGKLVRGVGGDRRRYTAYPNEISLADRPMMATATFTMMKADGSEEARSFKAVDAHAELVEELGKCATGGEYRRLVMAQNAETIGALDATDELPADWDGSTKDMKKVDQATTLQKNMGDVAQFAALMQGLIWFVNGIATEASYEMDGSPLPARGMAAVNELVEIFQAYVSEESREELTKLQAAVAAVPPAMMAKVDRLVETMAKVGARNSKADQDRIQAIHDHATSLGADCAGTDMTKVAGLPALARVAGELANARERMAKLDGENVTLKGRVAELEGQPAVGGPRLRAVARGEDLGNADGAAGGAAGKELAAIEAMADGNEKGIRLTAFEMKYPGVLKSR